MAKDIDIMALYWDSIQGKFAPIVLAPDEATWAEVMAAQKDISGVFKKFEVRCQGKRVTRLWERHWDGRSQYAVHFVDGSHVMCDQNLVFKVTPARAV